MWTGKHEQKLENEDGYLNENSQFIGGGDLYIKSKKNYFLRENLISWDNFNFLRKNLISGGKFDFLGKIKVFGEKKISWGTNFIFGRKI